MRIEQSLTVISCSCVLILDSSPFIGRCASIVALRERISSLAGSPQPLVIIGDPGTGKSLFATHIHLQSARRSAHLLSINFSILFERDQRIALFGGSSPDLPTTRRSLLELPSTLILKHVDSANAFFQDKLVEALSSGKLIRPGAESLQYVRCTPIFTFRSSIRDLYRSRRITRSLFQYLKRSEQITMPALRDRGEDIIVLAMHFLRAEARRRADAQLGVLMTTMVTKQGRLSPELREILLKDPWPDNVRGLKAFLGSLITNSLRDAATDLVEIELTKARQYIEDGREFSLQQSLDLIEHWLIDLALKKCDENKTKTSALLGRSARSVLRSISPNVRR